jgi:hypothetical protein
VFYETRSKVFYETCSKVFYETRSKGFYETCSKVFYETCSKVLFYFTVEKGDWCRSKSSRGHFLGQECVFFEQKLTRHFKDNPVVFLQLKSW